MSGLYKLSGEIKTPEHPRMYKMTGDHLNANSSMYNFNSGCSNFPTNGSTTTTSTNTTRVKWVKHLSSTPLTAAQESLLARGPNFAIVLLYLTKGEYVTAVEKICQKPNLKVAEELRAETSRVLKYSSSPTYLIREEARALKEMRKDRSCIIHTADKGVAMVFLDKQDIY